MSKSLVPTENIQHAILLIRGHRVIIDADLARLYSVTTKRLNEQVRRNSGRFPEDFMFQLTPEEKSEVVAICDHLKKIKYSRQLPYAFTEHGVIMAATVLNSKRAIEASIYVVRAFVKLREVLKSQSQLAKKLSELERQIATHDEAIRSLFSAIRQLVQPVEKSQRKIGFELDKKPH